MALDGEGGQGDGESGEPGRRFDARFRLEQGAAEGKGEVLFAHDEELSRAVVLKRTHSGEARALARLVHRHIVTVHDVLTVDDGPRAGTWLVMERVPDGSLSGRRFSPREAARIGAQIADALAALHRSGLIHCDVKPANIVMDAGETAKLTDFDAARRLGGAETISPDRPISYTPDYAGPELIGGRPDAASDVFSLGATVYALVTGNPPRPWAHGGVAADEGDERVVEWGAHHGVIEMSGDVGPLRPALTAMLQSDPGRRPTAGGARDALRDLADPPSLWRKAHTAARRRWQAYTAARRRWQALTAVAAASALAVTGTAWLTGRDDRPTPPAQTSPPAASPSARAVTEAKIVASKGPSTTYGNCRKNCAFVEFRATGLKPGTKYRFRPYTSNWGAFNPGASFTPDENGEQHTDNRFPCNAVGQKVWVVAEGPDGERIVSNKFTWTAG
ncbi:serine/threonine-protein kinase [Nonomuraea sp. NPDC005650]|uniref:serine/threonine-protein kinase n=1 Tax=Nonomuraea sp. NPDC005650 TaxID=3157045 RepID=UPI0033A5C968